MLGFADSAIAGGMENMDLAPYLFISTRWGQRLTGAVKAKRGYLLMTLERQGGHMSHAAEVLGITRKTLWENLRRLGIKARGET